MLRRRGKLGGRMRATLETRIFVKELDAVPVHAPMGAEDLCGGWAAVKLVKVLVKPG